MSMEEKNIKKIVSGETHIKKKSKFKKLTDVLIAEDIDDVKSYIIFDIIIPAIKRTVLDSVDTILNGRSSKRKTNTSNRISYRRYYEEDNRNENKSYKYSFDYDNVAFETRGDAEAVLSTMDDIIEMYGSVSVGDFYDMSGISTNNYSVNKYGWTDIRNSKVFRSGNKYYIDFPKPKPLD